MSDHGVPPGSLLVAFGVTGCLAWLAAGRRRGTAFIGTGLVAVQGVLHLTFMSGAGPHGGAPLAGAAPGLMPGVQPGTAHDRSHGMTHAMSPDMSHGMAHAATSASGGHGGPGVPVGPHGLTVPHGLAAPDGSSVAGDLLAGAAGGASAGMIAVHLLAAAVCALWLARGEVAFFRLARAVRVLSFTPLRLLLAVVRLPEAPRPPRPRTPAVRRHHGVVLAHTLSRRGPPAVLVPHATVPGATRV
ncbi:hypothetical protein [Streptomyces ficellus]|nr:hypothetical protein [Streptomyces ficellus]